jgi:hypothetical protein
VLWNLNEVLILVCLIAIFWVATEIGFRIGGRFRKGADETDKSHVDALQSALLGLLALLLGFSFAMSMARYDARKALVLKEANAIGTTYLRTDFLPADLGTQARKVLRTYVDSRLEFVAAKNDQAKLERALASGAGMQTQLWSIAGRAAALDPRSVPVGLFAASLNDVIDVSEERRTAFENHVPEAVLALLIFVSCGALAFIGCGSGLVGRRHLPSTISFAVISALVLVVILDMDRPRRGLIQVSQNSMLRLQASIAGANQ